MFKMRVYVGYKESVLDPQAEVIEGAIHRLGYESISNLKLGKFFEFDVKALNEKEAIEIAEKISDHLLANINMESYLVKVLEDN